MRKPRNCNHRWIQTDPMYQSVGYDYFECSKCHQHRKSKSKNYQELITKQKFENELTRQY